MGSTEPVFPAPEGVEESAPSEDYTFSGFGQSVYEKVPEELRPQVASYLKEFDVNFTKYAQETQGKLKPYQALGDVEELQVARQTYDALINQPETIYEYLVSIGVGKKEAQQIANQAPGQSTEPEIAPEYKAMMEKMADMEKVISAFGAKFQQQQAAEQEARDRAMFNSMLDDLQKVHGEFDRTLVTRLIAGGADPEEAVQTLKSLGQSAINQSAKKPPTVLSGSGAVPRPPENLKSMSDKDVSSFLANALSEINRNNQ